MRKGESRSPSPYAFLLRITSPRAAKLYHIPSFPKRPSGSAGGSELAMSELRWHPLLREWVITATERQDRTFLPPKDYCPLDPTRPGHTPTAIPAPDFRIAVFENRFPSLRRSPPPPAVEGNDLHPVAPARGVCEVVVYTPRHEGTLTDSSVDEIEE